MKILDRLQRGWRRPGWLNYALLPVSFIYRILMASRRGCYRLGVFRSTSLSVPVVVVGGITVGGSGKTPVVLSFVNYFKEKGYRPGVISRGYKGKPSPRPREVNDATDAQWVGDEPQLIHELTGVPVVVGPKRSDSGVHLIDKMGCDVLISDDGFQHHALHRDVDIVVLDGMTGFGNGWCLPSGPLREPAGQIERADIILQNGGGAGSKTMHSDAVRFSMQLCDAYNLADGARMALTALRGRPVHGVAAVGNPARFFRQLGEMGMDVIAHPFADHHRFSEEELNFNDDHPVLMTEKDGIKCRDMRIADRLWAVPARIDVDRTVFARVEQLIARGESA